LRAALLDQDAEAIAAVARSGLETYLRLRTCPSTLLRQLLTREAKRPPENEVLGGTPFGGPFVLLDDVFDMPIERTTQGWPALESVPAATMFQFLVVCQCGGAARAETLFSDPLWRRLFGIAPTISLAAVAEWLASLGPRCRRRYRRMLADHRAQQTLTAREARHRYRIAIDDDGVWRTLNHAPARADDTPDEAIGADIGHLLATATVPHTWMLLFALTAQRVLKRFLRKLPGFAASHLPYAQRNLLEFGASVDAQPERIVVLLGRPPLGMILNFTGSNRGMRRWPALDARPFALFNEH
jgi:hypothetical protein